MVCGPECMTKPQVFKPPVPIFAEQGFHVHHTAMDVKEEEDKEDDADMDVKEDKVAEQDITKAIDKDFKDFLWKEVEEEEEAEEPCMSHCPCPSHLHALSSLLA